MLNVPQSPALPPPVTAKRRVVKFREMSLNKRWVDMEVKDFEERKVLRRELKTATMTFIEHSYSYD